MLGVLLAVAMTWPMAGKFDRADADFQAALKLQPEQAPILNYLGYSWVDRNVRLALDAVGGAAGNIVYLRATEKIQQDVSTGTSLTTSMQTQGVFPPLVIQLTSIGAESGSLDSMLSKAADIYEAEVDELVKNLSALLEPIIMGKNGILKTGTITLRKVES